MCVLILQDKILSTYQGNSVISAANGRCDSPRKSAKYCTYSLMDHDTNKILHVETVDKREVRLQSPNMERQAFTRSMAHILQLVHGPEVITDASSSIRKIIGKFVVFVVVVTNVHIFLKKPSTQAWYILWMCGIRQKNSRKLQLR